MPVVQAKTDLQRPNELHQERLDEKLMKPGRYELTSEDTFTVEMWLKRVDKRWVLGQASEKTAVREEVVFRMWSYDEMVEMRKMATNYDPIKRIHMVDQDQLNRLKIQRLLVAWTFDKENPRLRIQHVNGVLTDEGWKAFTHLHPNICSFILERMNMVLDFNG